MKYEKPEIGVIGPAVHAIQSLSAKNIGNLDEDCGGPAGSSRTPCPFAADE
jgi:hypothetical protein